MSSDTITVVVPPPVAVTISPAGTRGMSAYEVWLAQGNVGTEQDFLDSLSSSGLAPGPGLKVVGSELRYDFASLTGA